MTAQELKTSILQFAIQGKLAPQNDSDGHASELLKRINTEKEQLIKEGKIKKDKSMSPISEEEIPFEVPSSWAWVRLGYLCQLLDGEKRTNQQLPYLEAKYLRGKVEATILQEGKFVPQFTRLILVDGENSGEVFFTKVEGYMGSTFKVLFIPNAMFEKYILYFLELKKSVFRNNKTGAAIPHLNKELFFSMPLPIPPLEEQKRIVAKIEELMPYIEEYGKVEEELSTLNEEFPEKLRKSILQLAVQGKLVPQNDSNEPTSELLKRIKAEKERLIKDGKTKKEKPLPPISEDEIPFEIPSTWRWVRLAELVSSLGDGIHGTPLFDPNGAYYFINGNNLINGKITIKSDTQCVSQGEYEKYKNPLNANTVLLSINGTIGNIAFYNNEPIILGKSACYISLLSDINKHYIRLILQTQLFLDYAVNKATQTTIKNVSLKAMRLFPVPMPPLEEQARIVARVEKLLEICEQLKS